MRHPYLDDLYDRPATMAEADREYATNVGADRPDLAWILSDRDVWYPNPSYRGEPQPHPDTRHDHEEDDMMPIAGCNARPPRAPTAAEKEAIAACVATDTGMDLQDMRGFIEGASIAVFDDYIPDGPGYCGRVAVVVWSGSAGLIQSFGFGTGVGVLTAIKLCNMTEG